ncbi:transcription factor TFIIIC subunit tfc4 [Elasticomyces elasticus]|nr:transcription factor TFIIIC subunit tfc4 [Elasticomyces elasticus]
MDLLEDERAEGEASAEANDTPSHDGWTNSVSGDSDDEGNDNDSLDGFSETLEALEEYDRDPFPQNLGLNGEPELPLYDHAAPAFGDDLEADQTQALHSHAFDPGATPPPTYANGDLAGDVPDDDEWGPLQLDGARTLTDYDASLEPDETPYDDDELGYEDGYDEDDEMEDGGDVMDDGNDVLMDDAVNYVPMSNAEAKLRLERECSGMPPELDRNGSGSPFVPPSHGSVTAAPPSNEPMSALSRALEQAAAAQRAAQAHWSSRNDLGFRDDSADRRNRDMVLQGLQTSVSARSVPTPTSFFEPSDVNLLTQQAGLSGLDVDENGQTVQRRAGRPRGGGTAGRVRGRGRGGVGWALKGTAHDPVLRRKEARAAENRPRGRPRGSGRGRGGVRGPRRRVDPGMEFKAHQTEAMSAFMDGDLELAMSKAQEAVKANPEVGIAHSLISEILRQMGREKDSISALLTGAALDRSPDMFLQAAERTLELDDGTNWVTAANTAMWCYSSAYNHSKEGEANILARIGIRDISYKLGDDNQARAYSKSLTRLTPKDFDNIKFYAQLCSATRDPSEISRAKIAYEAAFEIMSRESRNLSDVESAWSHVNIYLDLLGKLRYAAEGVKVTKRLARWILGRKEERFWDRYADDDREFDVTHDRRALVGEFQQGRVSRDKELYGDGLPLELRVKLGIFRSKMGMRHYDEAMRHLEHVLAVEDGPEEYSDVFRHVADSLRYTGQYEGAIKFYRALEPVMIGLDETFWLAFADCYESLHREGEAEDTYRTLIRHEPRNIQGRVKLARLYDRTGCKEQAMVILKEVVGMGHRDALKQANLPVPPVAAGRRPPRKRLEKPLQPRPGQSHGLSIRPAIQPSGTPQRSTAAVPKALPSTESSRLISAVGYTERQDLSGIEMSDLCIQIQGLWRVVEGDGDAEAIKEWEHHVTITMNEFRRERAFFGRDKNFVGYGKHHPGAGATDNRVAQAEGEAHDLMNRLEPNSEDSIVTRASPIVPSHTPTTYYGIRFGDWHRIIATLVLLYAERGDQAKCYDLIREVLLKANIFYYDDAYSNTGAAVALCCAIMFNDSTYAMELSRNYAMKSDLRAGAPYQLMAATTRMCYGNDNEFYSHPTKAYLARAVKLMDYNVMPPELRSRADFGVQTPSLIARFNKYGQEDLLPDAGVLTAYGNTMAISSHYTASLPYYFRALAVEPDNWSIILSIGLTYIHQAMKRQTDNRHYGIQQGLGFLQRYYDMRAATGKVGHLQEAEFNMAKTWHMLGLTHLAIPRYEKVLAMSEEVHAEATSATEGEVEDFAKEAAYALQQLFAVAGNDEAAVAITEQWLTM